MTPVKTSDKKPQEKGNSTSKTRKNISGIKDYK